MISTYNPEIIVVNGGNNQFYEGSSLIMNEYDIYQVAKNSPNSKIVVVHIAAVNHWNLSRKRLQEFLNENNLSSQIFIPGDGESYNFN